jgi:hypothetical protein
MVLQKMILQKGCWSGVAKDGATKAELKWCWEDNATEYIIEVVL